MEIYTITDWLGLVPIFICMIFGGIGCVQLMKGRSLFKVDYDIILLGKYYVLVVFGYLIFEMIPINYRPILIEGFMEASYPYERLIAAYQEARELNDEMEEKLDKPRTAKKSVHVLQNFSVESSDKIKKSWKELFTAAA